MTRLVLFLAVVTPSMTSCAETPELLKETVHPIENVSDISLDDCLKKPAPSLCDDLQKSLGTFGLDLKKCSEEPGLEWCIELQRSLAGDPKASNSESDAPQESAGKPSWEGTLSPDDCIRMPTPAGCHELMIDLMHQLGKIIRGRGHAPAPEKSSPNFTQNIPIGGIELLNDTSIPISFQIEAGGENGEYEIIAPRSGTMRRNVTRIIIRNTTCKSKRYKIEPDRRYVIRAESAGCSTLKELPRD